MEFHPLTPARWDDLVELFGEPGIGGGCWCMFWRLPRREYEAQKGAGNRRAFRALVRRGPAPGLLAYDRGEVVGWVAIGPREDLPTLERRPALRPIDDAPAWAISCLYLRRSHRRRGLTRRLIRAAVDHARACGARLVEGYPVEPKPGVGSVNYAYTGFVSPFLACGFRECARRLPSRPIVRRRVRERR